LLLLSLVAMLIAVARPTAMVTLPSQQQTIMLAIDVSLSMGATDVEPNRLTAAQIAAKSFIEEHPANARIGIVAFGASASLVQPPTRDKEALTKDGVDKVLHDLSGMGFEYIVCDSPAGIETGALHAMHFADEALVVTNPEVSSVRDSDRILGILASKTKRAIEGRQPVKEHLLVTRYNPNRVDLGQMLSIEDIKDILRIPLIGVIPESETVLLASNQGTPAVHMQGSDVSEAYRDVVDRFLGEERPLRFTQAAKQGFFKRLFATAK